MEITCQSDDRLLVFAPHPDDESLACGGLIRRARNAGADVRVVIATNGDTNPWPQRLTERRWRLDRIAVDRWAALRTSEAHAALQALGVDAVHAHFLQWADQGLTTRLVQDGESSVTQLAQLIRGHRPTLVAMPSVHDSHPDHSALAILLKAALRVESSPARLLSYWLHGRGSRGADAPMCVTLTDDELATKRSAALCHASQTHFGKSRLLNFVNASERFLHPSMAMQATSPAWCWQFNAVVPLAIASARRLRVVGISASGRLRASSFELRDVAGTGGLRITHRGPRSLRVELAPLWDEPGWVIAKLETDHRINVYDAFGWIDRQLPRDTPQLVCEAPTPSQTVGAVSGIALRGTDVEA
jgi:LmbE family N-acetylglucosaminyl deacetylase